MWTLVKTIVAIITAFMILSAFLAFLYFTGALQCSITYSCYKMWKTFIEKIIESIHKTKSSNMINQAQNSYRVCDVVAKNCKVVRYENGHYIIQNCEEFQVKCH